MLKRLRQLGNMRADFAFESTLSSLTFAKFLTTLKRNGYDVAIYYFALTSPQLAVRRVKLRVLQGGHNVPPDIVRRRYGRSLHNFFNIYMSLANEWTVFDNSAPPVARQVATKVQTQLTVTETATWLKLQNLSKAD